MSPWPTILSAARMIAAPIVAGLILWAGAANSPSLYGLSAVVFILAALTDLLDGWLARSTGSVTPFGAALDHAADKALVAGALVALAFAAFTLPLAIAAAILIVRDIAIAGLREGLSAAGRTLPVSHVGKAKAAAEMIAIAALLLAYAAAPFAETFAALGLVGLWLAAALALWSAAAYVRVALTP